MFILFVLLGLGFPVFTVSQTTTTAVPLECPGGSVAYQDIAVVYEISFYPDNTSLALSQQIANAISTTLFSGPTYQYFDDNTRITQITPIPFPKTVSYNTWSYLYNYGVVKSQADLADFLAKQVNVGSSGFFHHQTDSTISE